MNAASWIILAVIAVAFVFAVRRVIRKGPCECGGSKGGCKGGCAHCPHARSPGCTCAKPSARTP